MCIRDSLDGPFDAEQSQPEGVEHEHRSPRQPPACVRPEHDQRSAEGDGYERPVGQGGGRNCADEHVPQDPSADRRDDAK